MSKKPATKSVWTLCHKCQNHHPFPVIPTGRDKLGKVHLNGGVCALSYADENEAIRKLVDSGYKVCPGRKEGKCPTPKQI